MNWNLLFFLLVIVGLPFALACWGLWMIINNWSGPNGYRARAGKLWAGEKKPRIKEQKVGQTLKQMPVLDAAGNPVHDQVKGVKHILSESGHVILLMYIIAILIWYFLPVIGDFWVSGIFGLAVGLFTTISKTIDTRRGLKIAGVLFLLSLFFDFIIRAPLFIAATLFLVIGPPSFIFESVTKKDSFPWWMIDICLAMVGINFCLALLTLFGFDHAAFLPVLAETENYPLGWHLFAEAARVAYTGSNLFDAIKWVVAVFLILITAGPIDLAQKIKERKERKAQEAKDGKVKAPSTLTTARFIVYEVLIGALFRLLGRDEMGKVVTQKINPK